jgi:hypothetical protein
VLAGFLAGCASGKPVHSTSWLEKLRPYHLPAGPDIVQMDVALLERPLGDPFLNKEVWILADEQAIPLERKVTVEENGFRVGQIGGTTPAGLQAMLTSERSCVNPRRLYVHADRPTILSLGPGAPSCRFRIDKEGQTLPVCLEQAECTLSVVASMAGDTATRLHFTPQVRHGETRLAPCAAADRSGWVLQEQRPTESYSALDWEVTLAPNQYLVVGARTDLPDSLGYQCFLRRDQSLQRLLVIRASRASPGPAPEADSQDEDPPRKRALPLALQAAWTTARGSQP